MAFAQKLLHAEVVDAEVSADAGEKTALEGEECERRRVDRGGVDELEGLPRSQEAVYVNEATGMGAWANHHVFPGTDDEEGLVILGAEGAGGDRNSRFVVGEVDLLEDGSRSEGIDDGDARGPVILPARVSKVHGREWAGVTIS